MKTITFSIQKGGTGKTSISVSVAYELAKTGFKVLLIDADPQGNTTSWLNIETIQYELADLLQTNFSNSHGPIQTKDIIINTTHENLYLIGSAGIGGSLSAVKDVIASQSPYIFLDILEPIKKDFDYCIIDTSPGYSMLEKQIYIASDEIIPVLLLDDFSTDGLQIFTNNIRELEKAYRINPTKPLNKIIVNKINRAKTLNNTLLESFQKTDYELFCIPTDTAFEKSQVLKCFIQDFINTKKETLKTIHNLTEHIVG